MALPTAIIASPLMTVAHLSLFFSSSSYEFSFWQEGFLH